ncbi:hypothetical protein J6590_038020 [Homalodisca vitripennis]|nr:hypothetical protein J6590_038020 [Homalodisca vitripennis]
MHLLLTLEPLVDSSPAELSTVLSESPSEFCYRKNVVMGKRVGAAEMGTFLLGRAVTELLAMAAREAPRGCGDGPPKPDQSIALSIAALSE